MQRAIRGDWVEWKPEMAPQATVMNMKLQIGVPDGCRPRRKALHRAAGRPHLPGRGCDGRLQLQLRGTLCGYRGVNIKTQVYPGFPTDLQQPMSTLLTTAMGQSIVRETIFVKMSKIDNREQTDSVLAKISSGVEAGLQLDIMKNLPDFLLLESGEELYTYTSGEIFWAP